MAKPKRVYIDTVTLRALRDAKGWTMSDLARQIGVEVSTTARWEHRGWLAPKYVPHLAGALGVEPDEITVPSPDDEPLA